MTDINPCGIPAAYLRHWKAKEAACEPCKLAHRAKSRKAQAKYRLKHPEKVKDGNAKFREENPNYGKLWANAKQSKEKAGMIKNRRRCRCFHLSYQRIL